MSAPGRTLRARVLVKRNQSPVTVPRHYEFRLESLPFCLIPILSNELVHVRNAFPSDTIFFSSLFRFARLSRLYDKLRFRCHQMIKSPRNVSHSMAELLEFVIYFLRVDVRSPFTNLQAICTDQGSIGVVFGASCRERSRQVDVSFLLLIKEHFGLLADE